MKFELLIKKIVLVLIFALGISSAFAFGKKDKEKENGKEEKKEEVFDEFIQVDLRLNTLSDDGKNHFNWSSKENQKIKDSYDAKTGASAAYSTQKFAKLKTDKNRTKKMIPQGFYALMLYGVSPFSQMEKDGFCVEELSDGAILISFAHRDKSYRISTLAGGLLDLENGFEIAILTPETDENVESPDSGDSLDNVDNSEKSGTDTAGAETVENVDGEPGQTSETSDDSAQNLENPVWRADKAYSSSKYTYTGKIKATYSGGILKIQGKVKSKKIHEPGPEPELKLEVVDDSAEEEDSESVEDETVEEEAEPAETESV